MFDALKANPSDERILYQLGIYAISLGNSSVAKTYFDRLSPQVITKYSQQYNSLPLVINNLVNSHLKEKWNNYKRERNGDELRRMAATILLCKGNVLEIGCANGDLSVMVANNVNSVLGIDIDPVPLEMARSKCHDLGISNCYFDIGDGARLQFKSDTFDTVLLAEVLEHVANPDAILKEAFRVCKPGGRIVLSTPNGYSIPDPDHYIILNRQIITDLILDLTDNQITWVENIPNQWIMGWVQKNGAEGDTENTLDLSKYAIPPHPIEPLETTEKVSVIIPTFNRSNYIRESIDSVLEQTYPNKEIIVVNDGSTDETADVLKDYLDKIIYIEKENGGKSSAINVALQRASGKYVWVFDDDDIAFKRKLEIQVRCFQRNSDIGLVHTAAIAFASGQQEQNMDILNRARINNRNVLQYKLRGNVFFSPTVMVKRECFNKVGLWNEEFVRAQDYEMWTRIASEYKTEHLRVPTIFYRMHQGTRGTLTDRIEISELYDKTWDYSSRVVQKLSAVPIQHIFSELADESDHVQWVEAYLHRAKAMAEYQLKRECISDLQEAVKLVRNDGFVCFSYQGIETIKWLDNFLKSWMDPDANIAILYFLRMLKKANSS